MQGRPGIVPLSNASTGGLVTPTVEVEHPLQLMPASQKACTTLCEPHRGETGFLSAVTFSSFNTKSFGGGRKSLTTRSVPKGSSVYLMSLCIFLFINLLPSSPISSTNDTNDLTTIGKANGYNTTSHLAKTVVTLFLLTMFQIFCYPLLSCNTVEDHILCVGAIEIGQ